MNKQFIIIFGLTIFVTSSAVKGQDLRLKDKSDKNHFFLLAGAHSIYSGLSYERLILKRRKIEILPRIGFGLNFFKPSIGKEFNLHFGITSLYGGNHKIETGIGIINYLLYQEDIAKHENYYDYRLAFYGSVGYRYYFKNNPITIKLGFTPVIILNKDLLVFFPLAEIGIGIRL